MPRSAPWRGVVKCASPASARTLAGRGANARCAAASWRSPTSSGAARWAPLDPNRRHGRLLEARAAVLLELQCGLDLVQRFEPPLRLLGAGREQVGRDHERP